MKRTREDNPDRPIRVYWIWTPKEKSRLFLMLILALGAIVAWIFIYGVSLQIVQALMASNSLPATLKYVLPVCAATIGTLALFAAFFFFDQQRYRRKRTLRQKRLQQITAVPGVFSRFPHRFFELAYHQKKASPRKIRSLMRAVPPRTVIVVNRPANMERPVGAKRFFEPIDIFEDMGRLFDVLDEEACLEESKINKTSDMSATGPALSGRIWAILLSTLFLGLVGWGVYKLYLWIAGSGRVGAMLSAIVLCFILANLLSSALWQRRWYLVPGGLVQTKDKLWKKRRTFTIATPESSPLFLHLGGDYGLVVSSGYFSQFLFGESTSFAILSGWLSTARRPTMEEITAFVEGRTKTD